ncbi:MAG: L-glutamate gamma-semialdehyde dehydrogenase [Candidatus Coatesbacteria bacterium]|nr:L-glutamate gamma-semialdehyde dehydrogenase [Candidatus Coatesbacteria bacterium]
MLPPFKNEPYVNFNEAGPRRKMEQALELVKSKLGRTYPVIIDGEHIETGKTFDSVNPGNTEQVVGTFHKCTAELAEKALESANRAFETWRFVGAEERSRYLLNAARICRERIYELSAWMVVEEGKNWIEAYADVAEGIDFLEFYAREARRLAGTRPQTPFDNFENDYHYIPLGAGVSIPPWNFPFAIMAGITVAPIVCGNTVCLKPATPAPAIAWQLVEIFEQLHLPKGVLNFIPGSGSEIGDLLVDHPRTRFINFTGSMEVGMRIYERAAKVHHDKGQKWLKRTVLEMGGKDFVAADETAEVDKVVEAVTVSAFGFQGQKCSAGSRVILHRDIYDEVVAKLEKRVPQIVTHDVAEWIDGPAVNNHGPVINRDSYDKILAYIEIGKQEGRLLCGGGSAEVEGREGFYIQPTVFVDVPPDARVAQEEIFGPVTAVVKAEDFDQIIEIANSTIYGLTGALFSMDRRRLERGRRELHVGNLYLNRKCTGALVDVEPFGGFNMSGTDSKAGGRDYLLLFMQGKSISEVL